MSEKPLKVEKRKSSYTLYSLVGMFLLGGAFFYIAGKEIIKGDGSVFDILLALVTMLVTILLAWSFFNEPTLYTVYKDRLVMSYFWRKPKTLRFADVTDWEEQRTRGKQEYHYSLVLHTATSKVVIVSTLTDSYYIIKGLATKGKTQGSGQK